MKFEYIYIFYFFGVFFVCSMFNDHVCLDVFWFVQCLMIMLVWMFFGFVQCLMIMLVWMFFFWFVQFLMNMLVWMFFGLFNVPIPHNLFL